MLSSKIGATLFSIIAGFTLLVTLGFPLGEFTLGGQHNVLPTNLRIISAVSFIIQIFAVFVILQAGKVIPSFLPTILLKGFSIFFSLYLTLNVFMNIMSESPKEKLVMTPLAFITAICFWISTVNLYK